MATRSERKAQREEIRARVRASEAANTQYARRKAAEREEAARQEKLREESRARVRAAGHDPDRPARGGWW